MKRARRDGGAAPGSDERAEDGSFASLVGDVTRFEPLPRPGGDSRPPPRRTRNAGARPQFVFPEPLEPRLGRARDCSERALHRLLRGEPAAAERIDLHGFDREQARRALARCLESAAARNVACVLVIHGRGRGSAEARGVLRQELPGWLTSGVCGRHVRAFAPARQRDGGEGATYVLLRPGAANQGE